MYPILGDNHLKAIYQSRIKVACTGCEYCMPCPNQVPIPRIFSLYNRTFLFDDLEGAQTEYARISQRNSAADRCVGCGLCESYCPQSLPIVKELRNAYRLLAKK